MVITFVEKRKRQKILISALVIVVLITLFVLGQELFKRPIVEIETPAFEITYRKVIINFQLLENPLLKELQPFEKISPYEGEIGRENPFVPY